MTDWLIPFLCGLGASVLSAWGVGGGTLLLLVMTLLLDVDQRTAQGINLLFFLPAAASALFVHRKNGYLDRPILHAAIPTAAVAALGIVKKLDQLPLYFSIGASNGLLPLLAYHHAAGNTARRRAAFRFGTALAVGFSLLCLVAYECFAPQLAAATHC